MARLHAFGSAVGSQYQPGVSDIDQRVEFQPCDERFHINPCLAKKAPQGPHGQVTLMQRHDAGDAEIAIPRVGGLQVKHG